MNLTGINPKASDFKPERLKKDWRRIGYKWRGRGKK